VGWNGPTLEIRCIASLMGIFIYSYYEIKKIKKNNMFFKCIMNIENRTPKKDLTLNALPPKIS
jgi:hypothetical protein